MHIPVDETYIWGWRELEAVTGRSYEALKKARSLEGMPLPTKVRKGSRLANVWYRKEIKEWMERKQ